MKFVEVSRQIDPYDKTKKIVIEKTESMLNEGQSRVSTADHPLRKYPLYQDGSADVEWCDKHALSTAVKMTTNRMKPFFREVMRIIRLIRNQHIWIALLTQASAVLHAKGCREFDDVDHALHDALGPDRMEKILLHNPRGLKLPVEACVTRWGLLFAGAAELAVNLLFFAALFPLALAEGTRENKILAMKAVCSEKGFLNKKQIAYANPRVGRAVYYMMQPDFILQLKIVQFLHIFVWQPCLAASAHRNECAMTKLRGLGSIMRVVLWVLQRGIWAAVPFRTGKEVSKPPEKTWKMLLKLGHRGPTEVQFGCRTAFLFLSARLENEWAWRDKGTAKSGPASKTISPLQHLYGEFYTTAMERGISDLMEAIQSVCSMELAKKSKINELSLLPEDRKSSYFLHKISDTAKWKNATSSHLFRVQQAMWLVHQECSAAALALTTKYRLTMNDPMGFLAGMTEIEVHRVLLGVLEFDHGAIGKFFTAHVLARANAAVLWVQAKEILQHNKDVGEHLQSPLKQVFSSEVLDELKEFGLGKPVKEDLKMRGTLLSDEKSGTKPDLETLYYPVNRFKNLGKLAMLAAARPTNNNAIESRWSILTGKYMSGMRNAKGMCLSQNAKQPDLETFQMKSWLTDCSFHALVTKASQFLLKNLDWIRNFYEARHEASQKKMQELREDKARDQYDNTQIDGGKQPANKSLKDNKQPKRAERRAQPRNQASQLEASSCSDSEESSDSDDSEYNWSSCPSEAEDGIPAGKSADEDVDGGGDDEGGASDDQCADAEVDRSGMDQQLSDENVCPGASRSSSADAGEAREAAAASGGKEQTPVPSNAEVHHPHNTRSRGQISAGAVDGSPVAPPSGSGQADVPSNQPAERVAGRSEDEDCDWTVHPIEFKSELDEEAAKKLNPHRLNYTRWMLMENKWKRTEVRFQTRTRGEKIASAHLTRCDGLKFDLLAQSRAFYVLHTPMGLELASIDSLEPSKDGTLKVHFNRVLSTKRAATAAHSREDLRTTLSSGGNGGRSIIAERLGSDSLNRILQSQRPAAPTVVHQGDIAYSDFAHNIVGVVGWLTAAATEQEDKSRLLGCLRREQNIPAKVARDLACFDVVVQGQHFSDSPPIPPPS
jgi:hypothetical protein